MHDLLRGRFCGGIIRLLSPLPLRGTPASIVSAKAAELLPPKLSGETGVSQDSFPGPGLP